MSEELVVSPEIIVGVCSLVTPYVCVARPSAVCVQVRVPQSMMSVEVVHDVLRS